MKSKIKKTCQTKLSEKELKDTAVAIGKKLGFLIASLFVKDEERQAALALTEKMTPQQLLEYTDLLEEKYLALMVKPINEEYKKSLHAVYNDYQTKQKELNQVTMNKLEALEKEINN